MSPRTACLFVCIALASSACEQRPTPVTAPAGDKREPVPGGVARVQTADTDPERIVGGAVAMHLVPQPPQTWDPCHDAGPSMPWGFTDGGGGGCRPVLLPRYDRFAAQLVVAGPLILTDAAPIGFFNVTLFTVPTDTKCVADDGLSMAPAGETLAEMASNGIHGARYLIKAGHSLCCLGSGTMMMPTDGGTHASLKLVWSGFVPY